MRVLIFLAALAAATSVQAQGQAQSPAVALPPLPDLPLAASSVADSGLITLAPGRRVVLGLDGAHKPRLESEAAEARPDLPVTETARILEDNLDNFSQPYQPQITPGRLTISLWTDPKKGTVLTSANGTSETMVYVAAILAKRPSGNIARALTIICAVPAGGFNGQAWDDVLDAVQIIEVRAAPSRGCLDPRTGQFNPAVAAGK